MTQQPLSMNDVPLARRKHAVLLLSVYNAVNNARMALAIDVIVALLRCSWVPAWAHVGDVVTPETVVLSVAELVDRKLLSFDSEACKADVPIRGFGGMGRPLSLTRNREELLV